MQIRKIKIFDKSHMKKRIEKHNSTVHMRYKNDNKFFASISKMENPFTDETKYNYVIRISILASYIDDLLQDKFHAKSLGGFALKLIHDGRKTNLFSCFVSFDEYNSIIHKGKMYYRLLILSDIVPKRIYIRNRYFLRDKGFKTFKTIQNKIRKIAERGELNNEKKSKDI